MKPVLRIAAVLVVLTVVTDSSTAITYTKCGLAKALLTTCDFPRSELNNWVCLVQHESGYNTAATNTNTNKSKDYGIFQINSRYWCKGTPIGLSNDCGISCSVLLDSNIKDDCACARIIYKRHGFSAWYGWKNNCQGKDLSGYTKGCTL